MRDTNKIFHLAIPCKDLDETVVFYEKLGCKLARRYDDRVTFNFFGDQVVCHLSPENIDLSPKMYPRHFGITLTDKQEFNQLFEEVKSNGLPFFQDLTTRFKGKQEEHLLFFLVDPANNLLEFKFYHDTTMAY
ncbi:VOC family protein [Halalkalibacter alkalisediminis]|uniref:VOC family protein n=1 Tax=Halalkalibacter alkalisediminis TaxID=935616 RepID=A0ABV6NHV6_9BACI|nr:VOC family protein [Halalkalibacter alkalisediminis]